ncbi:MAG: PAS domain S-box protein [Gallionellaceae bacterium]
MISEKSFHTLFDLAADAIFILETDGLIKEINRIAHERLGYTKAEMVGKHVGSFILPEFAAMLGNRLAKIQKQEFLIYESAQVCKDGSVLPVEICSRTVELDGKIQVFSIVRDITERKRMLEALKQSEEKYRLLFENSRDALLINSPPSWRFSAVNQSAVHIFGAKGEDEFLSLNPWDISPERQPDGTPSPEKAHQMVATAMVEGAHLFEWTHKRLDGTPFPAEVLLTRMELHGEVFIQGSVRDISVRKGLEREAQEKRDEMDEVQKLHVAAQTAAAIAHELNQPLLAIASYTGAARMLLQAGKPDLDKIRNAVEASERQAQRAGQSIRELLEFLSMKEFSIDSFDLNQEILGALNSAKEEKEFQTILQLQEGLPLVLASRSQVRKVLLNLLHNGIEAMMEAGVPLPAISVTVRTIKDKNVAQVTIRDNGPGFRDEDIQRLFQPFFTTKARGIGLGLAISRSLVEANGGQLWVDPQEKPGATFHLTLPFAP